MRLSDGSDDDEEEECKTKVVRGKRKYSDDEDKNGEEEEDDGKLARKKSYAVKRDDKGLPTFFLEVAAVNLRKAGTFLLTSLSRIRSIPSWWAAQ